MTKFPSKDRFQFDEPLWKFWTKLLGFIDWIFEARRSVISEKVVKG
jgi:hypothetical protein